MKPNLDNVVKGAASYVGFILLVYFGINNVPAILAFISSIGIAGIFYYVAAFTIAIMATMWVALEMMYKVLYVQPGTPYSVGLVDAASFYAYVTYLNDQNKKLSHLSEDIN